jgi:hypothetical protein
MGMVMINCPRTGTPIPTGITTDRDSFGSSAVFFSRTFCPDCQANHEWFAKDAWVQEPSLVRNGSRRWDPLCSDAA